VKEEKREQGSRFAAGDRHDVTRIIENL